jgi:DAACS family dicarboxylate/amino acid:cation (Na+ or H+) symporter/aerobic C4-dicarboxylate transport protein
MGVPPSTTAWAVRNDMLMAFVMKIIPDTIGKYGIGSLFSLSKLMACVYLTCTVFVSCILGLICRYSGLSLWKFLRFIKEELFTVLGTSSSE